MCLIIGLKREVCRYLMEDVLRLITRTLLRSMSHLFKSVLQLTAQTSLLNEGFILGTMIACVVFITTKTAGLVVNPITVGNFAFLLNCTLVGRTRLYDCSNLKIYLLMRW